MLSTNPRILCVDDDQDSCELISLMLHLADSSYQVTTVSTARKLLDLIESQSFDLFLFDYALPEMTGIELCRRIRQTDSQTPILFYSAMAREIDRNAALAAGATEYLIKPNDLEKLTETVKRVLNKRLTISKVESSVNQSANTEG